MCTTQIKFLQQDLRKLQEQLLFFAKRWQQIRPVCDVKIVRAGGNPSIRKKGKQASSENGNE